jgi:hypothetical protein
MGKISLNNLLLISGEGRNVGKTTLGCKIVKELSLRGNVTAVKISPHFHKLTNSLDIIQESSSLIITCEKDPFSKKDSSRYLNAGASEVYYIQCKEDALETLSKWMQQNFTDKIPVICEAGGLKNFINPGYSIYIKNGIGENNLDSEKMEILHNHFQPDQMNSTIKWMNNKWQL